jgi:putative ABC transport system substrate-binding protein
MAADDPTGQTRLLAFAQALAQAGWTDGRNVRIDIRWGAGDPERIRKYAAELVALAPDVILASGGTTLGPLRQVSRTVPTVFTGVGDPVGAGFVDSLARPGGSATGFISFEWSISGKWLELLKEIAPQVTRAALLFSPKTAPYAQDYLRQFELAGRSFSVDTIAAPVRDRTEIERAMEELAREPKGGLVALNDSFMYVNRQLIIGLAARYLVPTVAFNRVWTADGGLIAYGIDNSDQYRRAAAYIDRILRGEKPGNLPVQAPTKFELVINLQTARMLGLEVSPTLLARADEVIE